MTQIHGFIWMRDRMRTADRWQDKLAYLWRPPEWTHDGRVEDAAPHQALIAAE